MPRARPKHHAPTPGALGPLPKLHGRAAKHRARAPRPARQPQRDPMALPTRRPRATRPPRRMPPEAWPGPVRAKAMRSHPRHPHVPPQQPRPRAQWAWGHRCRRTAEVLPRTRPAPPGGLGHSRGAARQHRPPPQGSKPAGSLPRRQQHAKRKRQLPPLRQNQPPREVERRLGFVEQPPRKGTAPKTRGREPSSWMSAVWAPTRQGQSVDPPQQQMSPRGCPAGDPGPRSARCRKPPVPPGGPWR
mmetsp:Transcript_117270/g.373558  ORF Transcript_117270/g.373558 Transcript_117270/m.373558 type:complete len:245 (+) Transcript_117270:659-1393(+)